MERVSGAVALFFIRDAGEWSASETGRILTMFVEFSFLASWSGYFYNQVCPMSNECDSFANHSS